MLHNHFPLKQYNSFALEAYAKQALIIENHKQLTSFAENLPEHFYILGGGSNSLFTCDYEGMVVCPRFKGVNVKQDDDYFYIEAASGENWHNLVSYCVEQGMPGLENLALIPGNCGAAPIQNIGAYGIEFATVCDYVKWFDFASKRQRIMSAEQCQFGYRDSVFKHALKGQGIITAIGLKLAKTWQPCLNYQGLNELAEHCSAIDVMNKVIAIRQSKLPDPAVLPNAGSFFKNPVVDKHTYLTLKQNHPEMPAYPNGNDKYKLAAGWLIDQCGLKGKQIGGAAVHKKQALVLVNIDNAQGKDVTDLAKFVKSFVLNKFNINLEPEVRIIAELDEVLL
ncbi:UDP-N-acetylmuramate dehydrogenase [Thalassotalea aquiviva]|uniref:UDP-N-acetylmuramate dehydrogenase n=1 Tax=Thalassotalea aquiviva TaxID=3242415 RepID=UPI00352A8817